MNLCYKCFEEFEGTDCCPHCGYKPAEDASKYPLALKPGSILGGKYIVGRVLGEGGFGITYTAQDYDTKQIVAIKEFFPSAIVTRTSLVSVSLISDNMLDSFNEGKKNFLAEAETISRFNGLENICDIYSYFEENGTAYFAMEYIDGIGLDSYIKQKGSCLSFEDAMGLIIPVMHALSHVHEKGIIHRDISPDNIMVTPQGKTMLIDFGAARYSMGEKSRSLDVILKHGFAPREQYARHGRQGPFTDVYAVAATFYYSITGKVPPDAIERTELDELLPPSAHGARLPKKAEQALMKALAVNYGDRYMKMSEFAQALSEAASAKEEPSVKPAGKKFLLPAAGAAAAIAAILLFGVLGVKDSPAVEATAPPLASPTAELIASDTTSEQVEEPQLPDEILWEFQDDNSLIISGRGPMEDYSSEAPAPWAHEAQSKKIKTVIIEEGISSVGSYAFSDLGQLENITLPQSLELLGEGAFQNCRRLETVNIPEGTVSIGSCVFKDCTSLRYISLPKTLISIDEGAFSYCDKIGKIYLPRTIETIHRNAFLGCGRPSVHFLGTQEQWKQRSYGAEPGLLASIDDSNLIFEYTDFGTLNDSVDWAFKSSGVLLILGSGEMPDFSASSPAPWNRREIIDAVSTLEVEEGISKIGALSFTGFDSLTDISLPKSLLDINDSAFSNCSNLLYISLPASIRSIGASAFEDCEELVQIILPSQLETLGDYAFSNCVNLEFATLPTSLKELGEGAFQNCVRLRHATLPNTLDTIPSYAFADCAKLDTVSLPSSIRCIEAAAFLNCMDLSEVYLPSGIESIGQEAFSRKGQIEVYYDGTEDDWARIKFVNRSGENRSIIGAKVIFEHLASGTHNGLEWTLDRDGTLTVSGSGRLDELGDDMMPIWLDDRYNDSIKKLIISEGITAIGSNAFSGRDSLLRIDLPDSLVYIGEKAFSNCGSLNEVCLPAELDEQGGNAFEGCKYLRKIYFAGGDEQWNTLMSARTLAKDMDPLLKAKLFTHSGSAANYEAIPGMWGSMEVIDQSSFGGSKYQPFIFDEPITDCNSVKMRFKVNGYAYNPFGGWSLYAKNLDGAWVQLYWLNIAKEVATEEYVDYELIFERPESFSALALCCSSNIQNTTAYSWQISFYAAN